MSPDLATPIDGASVASASYRLSSAGFLPRARDWQVQLYERLSQQESDAGYLLLAPCGAGKTESVVIPALGLRRGGAPRRLFLIAQDGSPLDDYLYRMGPYLKSWASSDEVPRTLIVVPDGPGEEVFGIRYCADGTEEPTEEMNPLEADVDLVVTTFHRFLDLFFGGGGVHGLASSFAPTEGGLRRDLFFFDEAHGYSVDAFSRFHRLVEFLFAQDTDVIISSSTMPLPFQEELSFLEPIDAPGIANAAAPTIQFIATDDALDEIEQQIRRSYYINSRVFGVCETPVDADTLRSRLVGSYPHSVFLYHQGQPASERRRIYAQLRELEKEGEGYLLLTTGDAVENSDLDATVLISTVCPPENLIRRAGRCNRRGDLPDAKIVVVGARIEHASRTLNATQESSYLAYLVTAQDIVFLPEEWRRFI
jgi:CRISPR-associated endonuclease/helicase Cas3